MNLVFELMSREARLGWDLAGFSDWFCILGTAGLGLGSVLGLGGWGWSLGWRWSGLGWGWGWAMVEKAFRNSQLRCETPKHAKPYLPYSFDIAASGVACHAYLGCKLDGDRLPGHPCSQVG